MDLKGLRVLLVDDDEATRYWIGKILENLGAQVTGAASAPEALTALDAAVPDILLCDIAMPEEDGYSLIQKIRARPEQKGGIVPAVALTAYATIPSMVEHSLRSGFQGHLTKPMAPEDLVAAVHAAIAGGVRPIR
jgi:CheY-like chemotaxis protein